ncbi:hypothetical protein T439DRAFT_351640 [Meredithblackwellia eburnea MCA 4105]
MHLLQFATNCLVLGGSLVAASLSQVDSVNQFIAYFPSVTSPVNDTHWTPNNTYAVYWNNTNPGYPDDQLHTTADFWLGFYDPSKPDSGYNYDQVPGNPLATNISLYGGLNWTAVTVPPGLPDRTTYVVNLRGSAGTVSAQFEISTIDGMGSDE